MGKFMTDERRAIISLKQTHLFNGKAIERIERTENGDALIVSFTKFSHWRKAIEKVYAMTSVAAFLEGESESGAYALIDSLYPVKAVAGTVEFDGDWIVVTDEEGVAHYIRADSDKIDVSIETQQDDVEEVEDDTVEDTESDDGEDDNSGIDIDNIVFDEDDASVDDTEDDAEDNDFGLIDNDDDAEEEPEDEEPAPVRSRGRKPAREPIKPVRTARKTQAKPVAKTPARNTRGKAAAKQPAKTIKRRISGLK
jgi:hypothetical protein